MRRIIEAVLLSVILILSSTSCEDPPNTGFIRLDIDRTQIGTSVSALDFVIENIVVFYNGHNNKPALGNQDCDFTGGLPLNIPPTPIHLDMTTPGRTFIGAFAAPPGQIAEIRLLINDPTIEQKGGKKFQLQTELKCKYKAPNGILAMMGSNGNGNPGKSANSSMFDKVGILQLIADADGGFQLSANQEIELAAIFDPNHIQKNDSNGNKVLSQYPLRLVPSDAKGIIIPSELIVRFNNQVSLSEIQSIIASRSSNITFSWRPMNYHVVRIPNGTDVRDEVKFYRSLSTVVYSMPDIYVDLALDPNDPFFTIRKQQQWTTIGAEVGYDANRALKAQALVAVIDTGVALNHADLRSNIFINIKEIPRNLVERWTNKIDSNGRDGITVEDFDLDNNGILTFAELNQLQGTVCPKDISPPVDVCNPSDIVSGDPGSDKAKYYWEDHLDGDNNGLIDDLVGWNFSSNTNLPETANSSDPAFGLSGSHGHWVAGTIGATVNNGLDIAGVASNVAILPIRVATIVNESGASAIRIAKSRVVAAIDYAAGATVRNDDGSFPPAPFTSDVINVSLSVFMTRHVEGEIITCIGGNSRLEPDISIEKFNGFRAELTTEFSDVQNRLKGALLITAVGNCRLNLDDPNIMAWPTSFNTTGLRVASSTSAGKLSNFSAYGESGTDLLAPGENFPVLQDINTGNGATDICPAGINPMAEGTGCNGTSFSAPMVAGAAAVLLVANSTTLRKKPCTIADRILRNVDRLTLEGPLVGKRSGRLSIPNMLNNSAPNNGTPVRICNGD